MAEYTEAFLGEWTGSGVFTGIVAGAVFKESSGSPEAKTDPPNGNRMPMLKHILIAADFIDTLLPFAANLYD